MIISTPKVRAWVILCVMHLKKSLAVLCLLLLGFISSSRAQAIAENEIRLTTPLAPWTIVISGRDLDIRNVGLKPGSTSSYVMMVDDTTKLNVSLYIEPAGKCKTSEECRDYILNTGNPAWGKFQNLSKAKVGDFSYFEFFRPEVRGQPLQMQDMYAQHVSGGYWVDLHISKVLYKKEDKGLFENMVKALKFVPKSAAPDTGAKTANDLRKVAESWLAVWDAGKCKETYSSLTSISREAVQEKQWIDYCQTISKSLGKLKSRKVIASTLIKSLPSKPEYSGATFRFESSFENHPLGPEFVSLTREKDGRWTVSHYLVQ